MPQKIQGVRGMEDLFDAKTVKIWQWIEMKARALFESAAFQEIRTPMVENADLFERSVGETTEIVEKEMYILHDRNGQRLALRPEGTASVVRAFIEHFTDRQQNEGRFYYMGPMFRYERPQKGRLRQFHQIGTEIFGPDHPLLDAEMIALAHRFFQELGLSNITLQLNSLGSPECRQRYLQALREFLQKIALKLCVDCQRRMERNPLRVLDCKVSTCIEATAGAPALPDFLSEESRQHFNTVQQALSALQVSFQLNPRLVRGLDYYEKTVFEFVSGDLGAQNTVAAGGRYNRLVAELGGPAISAVGFALGMERLLLLLQGKEIPLSISPRVYLLGLDAQSDLELLSKLQVLRERGCVAELDFGGSSLKSKMRRALRWQAKWVLIYGEEERKKGVFVLKNMDEARQEELAWEGVLEKLF